MLITLAVHFCQPGVCPLNFTHVGAPADMLNALSKFMLSKRSGFRDGSSSKEVSVSCIIVSGEETRDKIVNGEETRERAMNGDETRAEVVKESGEGSKDRSAGGALLQEADTSRKVHYDSPCCILYHVPAVYPLQEVKSAHRCKQGCSKPWESWLSSPKSLRCVYLSLKRRG